MGYVKRVCLTFVFSLVALGIDNVSGTLVSTESGAMEGVIVPSQNGDVYQFRKIPYAKPPIGLFRFRKPMKIPPWNNTLNATKYGPACIQAMERGSDFFPVSEDCLFLNVFVPNEISTTANKSVMIWIHGGVFRFGTGMSYDGSFLSLQGDVIVVTLNYRLGVFGFFSTGDSSARGNYGLWDQIEALKWIKTNIKYFGGNPESITLFGESAGALSISHLAIFPENEGLFHRVIMQSGSLSSNRPITNDSVKLARALGGLLQCSDIQSTESLVSCLRGKEASVLNSVSNSQSFPLIGKYFGYAMSYAPVIDGEMTTSHPFSLLQNRSSEQFKFYQSLDVICGCTSAEGSLFLGFFPLFPSLSLPPVNVSEGVPSWVLKLLAEAATEVYFNNDTRILPHIYNKYISTDIEEQGRLLVNFFSDSRFNVPMLESLLVHDRGGNSKANTFQYFFSKTSLVDVLIGVPPKWFVGAGHGAELPYLFNSGYDMYGPDNVLSTQMASYWTNFAKHGNPNIGLPVPDWPEFDENTRRFINLDTDITTGTDLLGDRIRFWTDEIPRILSDSDSIVTSPKPIDELSSASQRCVSYIMLCICVIMSCFGEYCIIYDSLM
ncbi:Carboxylesterase 4A [Mizuhopecten yessoensis]|uniref:Carboxylic ester hydrolase n=1 Tax=Mizuhopecten yessoensis TaxID=6573 RepID=A0A210PJD3_MIZYE|nr:Carboxylesterase 4A [Mizuhopecten yessoensis]